MGLIGCMVTTSYLDIITRSRIIGEKANVHPVYVLLGVIGGVALIGIPGVVIGPLTLALLNTFLKIFIRDEVNSKKIEVKEQMKEKQVKK